MAFLTIQDLSYITPEGHLLFEKLDLAFGRERTGLIGRNGAGKTTLLKILAGELPPAAGSLHRDGIVRLQRQQVFADKSAVVADVFGVSTALAGLRRALAGRAAQDEYADIDWSLEARLEEALATVGLAGIGIDRRVATLSGGQRTRLALAALTFDDPDMILLDEPTNNLDRDGRAMVQALLQRFRGGVLVASHDRDLLRHVDRIAELSTRGVRVYGGGWDDYSALHSIEREAAARRVSEAGQRLKSEKRKAQIESEKKARRDSAGRRSRSGGGDTKLAMDARADRAENTGKRLNRVAEAKVARAADELADARANVDRAPDMSFGLPSTFLPPSKRVLSFDRVTVGYVDDAPLFRDLSFEIVGPQRVSVTGPNGVGKTTLLRAATGDLAPIAGTVVLPVRATMLNQDAAILDRRSTILENFRRLNPSDSETACRFALASFLFRADAALRPVADLSGGEMIRAGMVCALGGQNTPELLILDEPTNHLDLDSIEAIETGLKRYDGAILIVSHDAEFLSAIGVDGGIELERT